MMASHLRRDVDFNGMFRKLGHSLSEIRVRALENILSKLEHQLVCEADLVQEKHLYIRLLEWFNFPDCSKKAEVLGLLNRLAQHSSGAELLQDIGGVEFLSKLRTDIEPCHRPAIDQILESIMHIPDMGIENHAPECIYQRPSDSAVWGASMSSAGEHSRSRMSHASETSSYRPGDTAELLGQHVCGPPGYFGASGGQVGITTNTQPPDFGPASSDLFVSSGCGENLFRLSTFPWLPLTLTDQHVIASTNSSLQTRDPSLLISACQFLGEVVFQDFPAELFLQRPEILKSMLSLLSLPALADHPVVIQACQTLTVYTRCLQARIRFFQDPVLYTSKQEFNSNAPSIVSTSASSSSQLASVTGHHTGVSWGDMRHRGDGQDGDSSTSASRESSVGLEPEADTNDDFLHDDGPRLQHQQLTLPQFCVALLQRSLPRLRTAHEAMGVSILGMMQETLTILSSVVDGGIWADSREQAREVVDRLTDCLESISELLEFHHHSRHNVSPIDADLGDLATHRLIYMGLVSALSRFLLMIPLEKMNAVLPERLKSFLHAAVFDEALAMSQPACRSITLMVTQALGLSTPVDFEQAIEICQSLSKTCLFCLKCDEQSTSVNELSQLADDALISLHYHLHLEFVNKFVLFFSELCSKKKASKDAVTKCTGTLLKLMSHPVGSVRQACYTSVREIVKKHLQVSHATNPKSKESLKVKFLMSSDILYEIVCFGLADSEASVRSSSTDSLHHLLQGQLLMPEALWLELTTALSRSLPILQSYTDQNTPLGRRLWSMLDPTSTSHNLALLDKLKGCLRIMYLSDKSLRLQAGKHIKWFLSNEHSSETKIPQTNDLDITKMDSCFILDNTHLVDEDPGRSVFTEEGMAQVYDIFTSDPVDPTVKKSAADQLAIMMKDAYLHALFKEKGGVEMVCSIIHQSVKNTDSDSESQSDTVSISCLSPCLAILKNLAHYDYSLRHTLARDNDLYYCLIRVSLLHLSDEQVRSSISHLLTLLLFDEVAKFDIRPGEFERPGTKFSVPAEVIKRYRLPFKPSCHHTTSPSAMTLPDPESDIMVTSGPKDMMKVTWNVAWQGGLEPLLDSFTSRLFTDTNNQFSPALQLTPVDRTVLQVSCVSYTLRGYVQAIRDASSHASVIAAVDKLTCYTTVLKISPVFEFFSNYDWYTALEKFLQVLPSSSLDQSLLLHVLHFISSALRCVTCLPGSRPLSNPVLSWLIDKLYQANGPLTSLMTKSVGGASEGAEAGHPVGGVKRSLDKELLYYVSSINSRLPYQLSMRSKPSLMRGDLVRKLQHRLNISEAPHFYNLASLEGTLSCLMHVTARPGWSKECSEVDAPALCAQLLNSLLEVVWSFHIGRGGTSRSFMGKGVTKSTSLCLRHLAYEMVKVSEGQDWVKNWLYSRQESNADQGFNWLLTLWAYRDPEVRGAGLGIAVALTSTESGRVLLTSHCRHIPGGIWGAAFSILLDSAECSVVCQQAALLLVNLTSQTMPSGEVEATAGTWQGPLVTDSEFQVVLVGVNALIALLEHTNFYACIAELLASSYTSAQIQPVLVTTEIPLSLESLSNSTLTSTDGSNLENTGRTMLTNVSSLSGQPAFGMTARSKHTVSTERSKITHQSSQENTLSSASEGGDSFRESQTSTPREITSQQVPEAQTIVPHGQNVATPSLIGVVVKLMTNLVTLAPQSSLTGMRSHSILSSLVSLISPATTKTLCEELSSGHSKSSSALALRDLVQMYGSIADLLTSCVITDTNTRLELLANTEGLGAVASVLLLQWPDKDDIGEVCCTASISVLKLFSSLLQTDSQLALKTLTTALGPVWSPLTEALCLMLDDQTTDRSQLYLSCLDFLSLLCCEEAKNIVKNPDRVVQTATISELLDAPLGTHESEDSEKTTGKMLGKALVNIFDLVTSPVGDEKSAQKNTRRLKVISAFKSLLAVSQSACRVALELGSVEATVDHLKETHAQLNLETLGMVGKTKGKKEEPLIQELIMTFNFLRNFMCNNPDIKVACYHSGLTSVVQRLWSWCQQDPELMASVLSLLLSYSAHCNSAASSLTQPLPSQATAKPGAQGSLLHLLLKLTQRELDRDECTPTLRLLFSLLTNLSLNADCRNVLWKHSFVNQFSQLNPRKRRGKLHVAMDTLWCEQLLSLSFSVDGQQIILKIPDVLVVLLDLMEAGSSKCQFCAALIVRNLACHAPNKPKLLASERLIPVLVSHIESGSEGNTAHIASSALWALVYNNHKAKVQVKSANIGPRLAEALHGLASSRQRSQFNNTSCDNLKAILNSIRE